MTRTMKNKKLLIGLIGLMLLMGVGGYQWVKKQMDIVDLEEFYGPVRNENFFRMSSMDTLSSTKVFSNEEEWMLDTIYMVDEKMLYVGYGSFSRTIVIYNDKGLLVEDPTLDCPWQCDEIFERCLISSIGKKLWLWLLFLLCLKLFNGLGFDLHVYNYWLIRRFTNIFCN